MENLQQYKNQFKQYKCCTIIPTYNNVDFIGQVVMDVHSYCDDIIVVNDGSTDETLELLLKFDFIQTISYTKNRGKGSALKTGFKKALELGYEYAISIDSDGQNFAKDIPVFLEKLKEHPNAIIIGARNLNQENMPIKNNFANVFSNFWFTLETGIKLSDTQSGFRLYPIFLLKDFKFYSNKYELELEVIVRASWNFIDIVHVPIDVCYPKNRITHFRPFKDFFRISILNTILVTLAFLYFRPRKAIKELRKKSIKQIIWENFLSPDIPVYKIALSIAFGVFMGILPIWGYQLIVGFALAHLLKLNKTIFFISANISIPPMIPLILYLSYVTGSFVLGEGSWTVNFELSLNAINQNLAQYIIGSITLSIIAALIFGIISYFILLILKKVNE